MSHCVSNFSISRSQFKRIIPSPSTILCIDSQNNRIRTASQTPNKQLQLQPQTRLVQLPLTGLLDRFGAVQQMMEDPLMYTSGAPRGRSESGGEYGRGRKPWEIKEMEKEYKMRFDMPGMTKQDVKVRIQDKMLVLKAEKVPNSGSGDEDSEWPAKSYGKYSTTIALPENVEFDKIKAEVKDGVLYITVPKATTAANIFDVSVD